MAGGGAEAAARIPLLRSPFAAAAAAAPPPPPAAAPPPRGGRRHEGAGVLARLWRAPWWAALLAVTAAGAAMGLAFPNPKLRWPYSAVQSGIGWAYTLAWSLSFWPQVLLNRWTRSVVGLSFDFLALNLLGWVAYSTFNVSIYYVFECRKPLQPDGLAAAAAAAAAAVAPFRPGPGAAPADPFLGAGLWTHSSITSSSSGSGGGGGGSYLSSSGPRLAGPPAPMPPGTSGFCQYAVEFNDVVFSLHALVLTLWTARQAYVYPRGGQRVHGAVVFAIFATTATAGAYAAAIAAAWSPPGLLAPLGRWLQWVYWLYYLSFIKMGVTLVKYLPQAFMNCRRRSTEGWSLLNVLLDAMGGLLSMGQQLVTCWWARDWSPITANPVKLGLAVTSLLMDAVFVAQHFAYYELDEERRRRRAKRTYSLEAAAAAAAAAAPAADAAVAGGVAAAAGAASGGLRAPLLPCRSVTVCIEEVDEVWFGSSH